MALERMKLIHGVVIRVSGDTGQQIGAHVEYVERVVDGAEVISARLLPPEPLATGADALAPLIGEIVIAQQAELEGLRGEAAALTDALAAEREAHEATRAQATQDAEASAAERTELLARIEAQTPAESA